MCHTKKSTPPPPHRAPQMLPFKRSIGLDDSNRNLDLITVDDEQAQFVMELVKEFGKV